MPTRSSHLVTATLTTSAKGAIEGSAVTMLIVEGMGRFQFCVILVFLIIVFVAGSLFTLPRTIAVTSRDSPEINKDLEGLHRRTETSEALIRALWDREVKFLKEDADKAMAEANNNIKALAIQNGSLVTRNSSLQNELREARRQGEEALATAQKRIAAGEGEILGMHQELEDAKGLRARDQTTLHGRKTAIKALRQKLREEENQRKALVADHGRQLEEAEGVALSLRGDINNLQSEVKSLEELPRTYKKELQHWKGRVTSLLQEMVTEGAEEESEPIFKPQDACSPRSSSPVPSTPAPTSVIDSPAPLTSIVRHDSPAEPTDPACPDSPSPSQSSKSPPLPANSPAEEGLPRVTQGGEDGAGDQLGQSQFPDLYLNPSTTPLSPVTIGVSDQKAPEEPCLLDAIDKPSTSSPEEEKHTRLDPAEVSKRIEETVNEPCRPISASNETSADPTTNMLGIPNIRELVGNKPRSAIAANALDAVRAQYLPDVNHSVAKSAGPGNMSNEDLFKAKAPPSPSRHIEPVKTQEIAQKDEKSLLTSTTQETAPVNSREPNARFERPVQDISAPTNNLRHPDRHVPTHTGRPAADGKLETSTLPEVEEHAGPSTKASAKSVPPHARTSRPIKAQEEGSSMSFTDKLLMAGGHRPIARGQSTTVTRPNEVGNAKNSSSGGQLHGSSLKSKVPQGHEDTRLRSEASLSSVTPVSTPAVELQSNRARLDNVEHPSTLQPSPHPSSSSKPPIPIFTSTSASKPPNTAPKPEHALPEHNSALRPSSHPSSSSKPTFLTSTSNNASIPPIIAPKTEHAPPEHGQFSTAELFQARGLGTPRGITSKATRNARGRNP
ncbi:uncharacterized protein KY384_000037 [Bacidia gigantensis]|uniref:uncharacterized protein n=1 Tax=Bacidia gigantensis TaxID=2732470 RepID=UPI001D0491AC|nr:uncharacterized protein KY384_000037 [Bacidia gigantensis]KAG8526444.1 hypothetical protein KY384_000037 [Bacidia gigantensis]